MTASTPASRARSPPRGRCAVPAGSTSFSADSRRRTVQACTARIDDDGGQLQQGQHGGGRQVEDLRGLPVDLHLQGRVRGPAEDLDDAEGGEGEQEHHHGRRGDRRGERGQRHPAPGGQAAGAEHPRGLLLARVELRPHPADGADHDGVVEEDVRDEDRPHRGVEPDAEQPVGEAVLPEQREERRSGDDGRQHERHGHHGPQQPLAGEVQPGEDVRRRAARPRASARWTRRPASR